MDSIDQVLEEVIEEGLDSRGLAHALPDVAASTLIARTALQVLAPVRGCLTRTPLTLHTTRTTTPA